MHGDPNKYSTGVISTMSKIIKEVSSSFHLDKSLNSKYHSLKEGFKSLYKGLGASLIG